MNHEQFALAMLLVNQKINGIDTPQRLTPEMVPPSLRGVTTEMDMDVASSAITNSSSFGEIAIHSSGSKELEAITKEIDDLKK